MYPGVLRRSNFDRLPCESCVPGALFFLELLIEERAPRRTPTTSTPLHSPLCQASVNYVGGCQNDGPFSGTLNIACRIIIEIQKGTIILATTHVRFRLGVSIENSGFESKAYGLNFKM